MKDLLHYYLELKNKYRTYDTKDALKRVQSLRYVVKEMADKGYSIAFEILGSINFGIVEPSSDADCILLHRCSLHSDLGECPPQCSNLIFEQEEIVKILDRRLGKDTFRIELLDNVNMNFIERSIEVGNLLENEYIYRFLFYRNIGRPVNRPLFIKYTHILEENPTLMWRFVDWASEALEAYIKTERHRFSFAKYNERIMSRGLQLPFDLTEELKLYLEQGRSRDATIESPIPNDEKADFAEGV